jgi:AcrR family transcriptional regulator
MASLPDHLSPAPVGRERLPRTVMEEHQRSRVLAAAAETIAKRGYNSTTVDHIVAAAGIGVGTFYDLFENKQDCFLRAYERILAAARERIAAAIPRDRPWSEQACAALRETLALIVAQPLDARLALVEIQTAGPKGLARYEATLDEIAPCLRRGRDSSPLADELPATLETATVGGILWLLQQRILEGEVDGLEALLPELTGIVVEPYLGEAEAKRSLAAVEAVPPLTG